ncbi:MAG: M50 family metallopeptidase [Candidatus Promineifilaceae bacterium]
MRSGFSIGRIFGIQINIDWSWLLIFVLVTWNLVTLFGNSQPGWGLGLQIGVAVVAALLFFASVLAHELAHSLVAVAQGVPVRNITLFLFGGVSNIQREPPSPRAEFLITIVGPITSIVLGVLFLLLGGLSLGDMGALARSRPEQVVAQLGPVSTLLLWLGPINIILGLFNLIPGFPLDGGRVLRSILWAATDNLRRATRWAARVGQVIAWLFIIAGIAMVFGVRLPIFGTGLVSGLWLAFIGWFLNSASVQSYQQVVVRDILEGIPVRAMMRPNPPTVPAGASVEQLVHETLMTSDDHAFPVQEDGRLAGVVTLQDVRGVPRDQWGQTTVGQIMTPRDQLSTINSRTDANEALRELMARDVRQLPVMDDGKLVGVLRRRDIMRWLQLNSEGDEPF